MTPKSHAEGRHMPAEDEQSNDLPETGYRFPILEIPAELRDLIYDFMLADPRLVVRKHRKQQRCPQRTQQWSIFAMLLVNKQVSHEFRTAVYRNVPHQLTCKLQTCFLMIPEFGFADRLGKKKRRFLDHAHLAYLYVGFDTAKYFGGEQGHQDHIITSQVFKDVINMISRCTNADLLVVRLHLRARLIDPLDYNSKGLKEYRLLFNRLVPLIETLPRTLQYIVDVRVRPGSYTEDGRFLYARCDKGTPWKSAGVVRETKFGNVGQWLEQDGEMSDKLREQLREINYPKIFTHVTM